MKIFDIDLQEIDYQDFDKNVICKFLGTEFDPHHFSIPSKIVKSWFDIVAEIVNLPRFQNKSFIYFDEICSEYLKIVLQSLINQDFATKQISCVLYDFESSNNLHFESCILAFNHTTKPYTNLFNYLFTHKYVIMH